MHIRKYHESVCLLALIHLSSCIAGTVEDENGVAYDGEALKLNIACNDTFEDVYKKPNGLPNHNPNRRGDVVRCSKGRKIAVDEISASLSNRGFVGLTGRKPVRLLRITYRTERLAGKGDLSSALVLLPVKTKTSNSKGANRAVPDQGDNPDNDEVDDVVKSGKRGPLIVFAHGTSPYGTSCAPSRLDPLRDLLGPDGKADPEFASEVALASQGYQVIVPDYPGYIYGSTVAGYLLSGDEAPAVLDATKAMPKLLANAANKVVFLGHSQGGHAVLSAQAVASTYGVQGQLVGVATLAPFWGPGRTFGAILATPDINTMDDAGQLSFAIEYFYSHAEVYEGPGAGAKLFTKNARMALPGFVSSCNFFADPSVLGNTPADLFVSDFLRAVQGCGASPEQCSGGLAGKWEDRFRADRPSINKQGAPILIWQGALDEVVPAALTQCGVEKIRNEFGSNNASKFKFCGDGAADHDSILSNDLAWVTGWIEARANGAAEPACAGVEAIEAVLGPLTCLTPPGNQD